MKNILRFLSVMSCLFSITNLLDAQWVQTSCPISDVHSFAVIGTNLFAGTSNGVYLTTDNGISWIKVNSGIGNSGIGDREVTCLAVKDTNLFAGTEFCGVFLSTDSGTNWNATGLTNTSVNALVVNGTNLLAGTNGDGVFLSTNNGTNWTKEAGWTNRNVCAFAVSGTNLFAGTAGDGVFISTNNGISWSAINSGLENYPSGLENYPTIFSLAILPNGESGTSIFAGTDFGVYLSTNEGTSWNAINSGLHLNYITALAILPNGKGDTNLFAGTIVGVWQHPFSKFIPTIFLDQYRLEFQLLAGILNQTKTVTLKIINSSLAPLIIDSVYTMTKWFTVTSVHGTIAGGDTMNLPISFSPNTARDTTYVDTLCIISNSIYSFTKLPLIGMLLRTESVLETNSDVPKNYGLSQNYPNPFNPTTVINYQLPVSNIVTLKVYDMLGREVAILLNERKSAGYYNVTFNAAHLPSGIYFYRLKAGSYTQTKKLVLLK